MASRLSSVVVLVMALAAVGLVGCVSGTDVTGDASVPDAGGSADPSVDASSGGGVEATGEWIQYEDGRGAIVGYVENTSDRISEARVSVDYTAEGGRTGSPVALLGARYILPGQRVPFCALMQVVPTDYTVMVEPRFISAVGDQAALTVVDDVLDLATGVHSGLVRNDGGQDVSQARIHAAYFDSTGSLVSVWEGYCDPPDLSPGETADFGIYFGAEAALIDRAELTVSASWSD